MDCEDDSDFQNQNIQLAGEDNRFSSNLRSFSLPKFDIDEHLHVHLRFDSLGDPDILLGMHGQENNWIEDFSAGNAIEFMSGAAESRSISCHNNVWSEATSSESVEMLLKSVGEDGMLDEKGSEIGKDVELGAADNPVYSCSIHADSIDIEKGDALMRDPAPPPDNTQTVIGLESPQNVHICQTSGDETSLKDSEISSLKIKSNSVEGIAEKQYLLNLAKGSSLNDTIEKCHETEGDQSERADGVFMQVDSFVEHSEGCPCDEFNVVTCELAKESPDSRSFCNLSQSSTISAMDTSDKEMKKNQISLENDDVKTQSFEGHSAEGDHSKKISPPLEQDGDLQIVKCSNTVFTDNQDEMLESPPFQITVLEQTFEKDSSEKASEGLSSAMKDDAEFVRDSVEIDNKVNATISSSLEQFPDASHAEFRYHLKADDLITIPTMGTTEVPEMDSADIVNSISSHVNLAPKVNAQCFESHSAEDIYSKETSPPLEQDGDLQIARCSNAVFSEDQNEILESSPFQVMMEKTVENCSEVEKKANEGLPLATKDGAETVKDSVGIDNKVNGTLFPSLEQLHSARHVEFSHHLKIDDLSIAPTMLTTEISEVDSEDIIPSISCLANLVPKVTTKLQPSCEETVETASAEVDDNSIGNNRSSPKSQISKSVYLEGGTENSNSAVLVHDVKPEMVNASAVVIMEASPSFSQNEVDKGCNDISAVPLSNSIIGFRSTEIADSGFVHTNDNRGKTEDVSCAVESGTSVITIVHKDDRSSVNTLDGTAELSSLEKETVNLLNSDGDIVADIIAEQGTSTLSLPTSDINLTKEAESQTLDSTCPHSDIHTQNTEESGPVALQPNSSMVPGVTACSASTQDAVKTHDSDAFLDSVHLSNESTDADSKIESSSHDSKLIDNSYTCYMGSLLEPPKEDESINLNPSTVYLADNSQVATKKSRIGDIEQEEGKQHDSENRKIEDKTNVISSTGKSNSSKRKLAKEASSEKQTPRGDGKSAKAPVAVGVLHKYLHSEQVQQLPYGGGSKLLHSPVIQTSCLPDLNSSISPATLFLQPFTDLQQVQLRAQIFVYGSLIQDMLPDEACLISAFGGTDGRNLWDGLWRASIERFQTQKSPLSTCETPPTSHSGLLAPESRVTSAQNKCLSTPVSQACSKAMSGTLCPSSSMPLSSSFWSVPSHDGVKASMLTGTHLDFSQLLSPYPGYSHQSSQTRHFLSSGMVRPSQMNHPGSTITPSRSSTATYSTFAVPETTHSTPVRDSLLCNPPPQPGHLNASAVTSIVQIETPKKPQKTGSIKNASVEPNSRKKKKVGMLDDPGSALLNSRAQETSASANARKLVSSSASVPVTQNSPVIVSSCGPASATPNIISPNHFQIISKGGTEQRAILSEETSSRVEQAKLQAEEAAALAASAVRHSQGIWSQLAIQKNSGLVSEVEEKLASAAVAAAAAAAVAKAAAAAAKVASDAALQSKMMADDAIGTLRKHDPCQTFNTEQLDAGKNVSMPTPVSILKGRENVRVSGSILSVARDATRRRMEAASAATKRAENLDAILKAAELAAEAVCQAGTIVTMGENLPFTLNELVEHGPDAFLKLHTSIVPTNPKSSSQLRAGQLSLDDNRDRDNSSKLLNTESSISRDFQKTNYNDRNFELPVEFIDKDAGNECDDAPSTLPSEELDQNNSDTDLNESIIQKDSLVEVASNEENVRGVWFSASVLDLKDGEALVCYNSIHRDEGSGQLKEWIPLDGQCSEAPRIRIAHPVTAIQFGANKKRRRDDVSNLKWAVGDHVDAWMRDGWREGIVTEVDKEDETTLTIHFGDASGGDSSAISAWNLRPSLMWKDGQWIEWSRLKENSLHEGETPHGKRQRVGKSVANAEAESHARGDAKTSKNLRNGVSSRTEDSRPLSLSAKDRTFSIGKNGRGKDSAITLTEKRIGLQKGGSGVVFGVPKPGKKRKFMEVSKHYVADKGDRIRERSESNTFAKFLMPQQPRIWRSTTKAESKVKESVNPKPKGLNSVRSKNVCTRSATDKDNAYITTTNFSGGGSSIDPLPASSGLNDKDNAKENIDTADSGSFHDSHGTAGSPAREYLVPPVSIMPSSKKSSASKPGGIGLRGKHSTMEKPSRSDDKGNENSERIMSEAAEPRRSNRRIQPTSRLLEGLQSSLLVSKIPSVSHDKGTKPVHRGVQSSRGRAL